MNHLPEGSAARKNLPVATGFLDYFPKAAAYVAFVSKLGNEKHNPGEPLHWARGKSDDHADCVARHLIDRGKFDATGVLHDGMLAWRALANCELALEAIEAAGGDPFALFGGQKAKHAEPSYDNHGIVSATPGGAAGEFTGTVTIDEHSHGDDHHAHPDPSYFGSHSG